MIALFASALAGNVQLATFEHVVQRIPAVQIDGQAPDGWTEAAAGLRKRARKARTTA